jgi:putative acetyltransferase
MLIDNMTAHKSEVRERCRRLQSGNLKSATRVKALFVEVNRRLAPPHMAGAFEDYIARSISEEICRIPDYYKERFGTFWVATSNDTIVGMFGLELVPPDDYELRRMYVDPTRRRQGIASTMLTCAETECRQRGASKLVLSTSELQPEAIAFYRNAGYSLYHEGSAIVASNKTIGGGVKRFHFEKPLYSPL